MARVGPVAFEGKTVNKLSSVTPGKSQIFERNWSEELDAAITMGRSWRFRAFLSVFLLLYTLIGAWIFQLRERSSESETLRIRRTIILSSGRLKLIQAMEHLSDNSNISNNPIQFTNSEKWNVALSAVNDYESDINSVLGGKLKVYLNESEPPQTSWELFHHAYYYFVFILTTTIGYGSLTPTTMWGRIFCVNYALIGIPVMLIFIAQIGKILARLSTSFLTKMCGGCTFWRYVTSQNDASYFRKLFGTLASLSAVVILLFCYMGIGAILFDMKESWGFINSFYFCFITLTTVGFGDLIPLPPEQGNRLHPLLMIARVLYIFCGLGITATAIELVQYHYTEIWIRTDDAKRKFREKCKKNEKMAIDNCQCDIITPAVNIT